jgi:glutathionylspermidine synthase
MQRVALGARPDWREKAQAAGFVFTEMYGEIYWEEAEAYEFSLRQIDRDILAPSTELHAMCREAADRIVRSEELMLRLAIPREHWDLVAGSWHAREPELYGRFDLAYDGQGPAKMLEYNADTPTALYETAAFQWEWLEDQITRGVLPPDADQFNRVHEALVERFRQILPPGTDVHFGAWMEHVEDQATVEQLAYAARDAGHVAWPVHTGQIGISDRGQFTDEEGRVIGTLFLLYPWEDMLRDDFGRAIASSGCRLIEPAWKAVMSNKGLLPVLWRMFEGHPNLLSAFFEDELGSSDPLVARSSELLARAHVRKPLFSREGCSVRIVEDGKVTEAAEDRRYDENPVIVQAYQPLPVFGGNRPVLGAWIIGETCEGLCIREDTTRISSDMSRFKPHFIVN